MEHKPNRLYKSRLFVMIFADRRNLLELYNAVSGKNYKDPELLEIITPWKTRFICQWKMIFHSSLTPVFLYMSTSPPTVRICLCAFCFIWQTCFRVWPGTKICTEVKKLSSLRLSCKPYSVGICRIYRTGQKICQRIPCCRCRGAGDHWMYPGNSEYFPVFLNSSSFRQIRNCFFAPPVLLYA